MMLGIGSNPLEFHVFNALSERRPLNAECYRNNILRALFPLHSHVDAGNLLFIETMHSGTEFKLAELCEMKMGCGSPYTCHIRLISYHPNVFSSKMSSIS
jgi:hypothetical protein